jgi:hypothetical protein
MNKEKTIEVLVKIARALNDNKITWAIGGSLMLYFKGITDHFQDIDIMVIEEDVHKLKELLLTFGIFTSANPIEKYKTKYFLEFIIDEVDIDIMAGFSIVNNGKEFDCSLKLDQIYENYVIEGVNIPIQSPELWREYYSLMGRKDKVEMINRYYAKNIKA